MSRESPLTFNKQDDQSVTASAPVSEANEGSLFFWPKISVVTPSYNQGDFIEATIQSVLQQKYANLEYIIIDGGSTDNTIEIIKKYEPWIDYWVSEPDNGQSHAINKGIQKATGQILLWLNSDDICLPNIFFLIAETFRSNPACMLVIGQARVIDRHGQIIGDLRSHFTSWDELVTNPRNSIRQVSTFFSRQLFEELGLIDETLHIAMDTELLIRFTQFHTPLVLNEYVTAYRLHTDTKTHHQLIEGYRESDHLRRQYIQDKKKMSMYHRQSSANWLSLSELPQFTIRERLSCLLQGIGNRPATIFSRDSWSSMKKLCLDMIAGVLSFGRKQ